jgi:Fur family ferric uptake transcriptional regulator
MGGDQKLRMTRQRRLILEAVSKVGSHPTADEVYARVKRRLPHISLGTVYRNLDTLAERGMIGKLELGGSQKRYDGSTDGHHHIRCLECGLVVDASAGGLVKLEANPDEPSGYAITGFRLELLGYCPRCRKRGVPSGAAGSDSE